MYKIIYHCRIPICRYLANYLLIYVRIGVCACIDSIQFFIFLKIFNIFFIPKALCTFEYTFLISLKYPLDFVESSTWYKLKIFQNFLNSYKKKDCCVPINTRAILHKSANVYVVSINLYSAATHYLTHFNLQDNAKNDFFLTLIVFVKKSMWINKRSNLLFSILKF